MLRLLSDRSTMPRQNRLVAPTLLRPQVLSHLFEAVRHGDIDRAEPTARLDNTSSLDTRLRVSRALQKVAWDVAEQLDWANMLTAEYVALTRLQADAFVTLDDALARSLQGIVPLASFDDMTSDERGQEGDGDPFETD